MSDQRPVLTYKTKAEDFRDFYWLKEELVRFCRTHHIPRSDSKAELTERIYNFLKTGIVIPLLTKKSKSTFDWKNEVLNKDTIITDNYQNTENVRSFFKSNIGEFFKFNIAFMQWMKENQGKSLSEACNAYTKILEVQKDKSKKPMPKSLEYNKYIKDFMADNNTHTLKNAISCWKYKKSIRGHNRYEKTDLQVL